MPPTSTTACTTARPAPPALDGAALAGCAAASESEDLPVRSIPSDHKYPVRPRRCGSRHPSAAEPTRPFAHDPVRTSRLSPMQVLPTQPSSRRRSVSAASRSRSWRASATPLHVYDEATLQGPGTPSRRPTPPTRDRAAKCSPARPTRPSALLFAHGARRGHGDRHHLGGRLASFALATGAPPERIVVHGDDHPSADLRRPSRPEQGCSSSTTSPNSTRSSGSPRSAGRPAHPPARHARCAHRRAREGSDPAHTASKVEIAAEIGAALDRAETRARAPRRPPRPSQSRIRGLDRLPPCRRLARGLRAARRLPVLDLGGGLRHPVRRRGGADLRTAAAATAAAVADRFGPLPSSCLSPGSVVGTCGMTLAVEER